MYNAKGEFKPVNIENMINDGFDINEIDLRINQNLLMHAAMIGNLRFLKLLISKHANIKAKNVIFN